MTGLVEQGLVDLAPLPENYKHAKAALQRCVRCPPHLLLARYEEAKVALAEAATVDECASWTDKTAALDSYARQAKDESILRLCRRIRRRFARLAEP